jgi:K+-sensing histidine kinase KdpD
VDPLDARAVDEKDPGAGASEPGQPRAGRLAFIAHEARNPLATALWTAELLARMSSPERGGARGEKLAAMCLRSILRVRQVVEDHFLSERLDAGGLPFRLEPVGLADAIGAVLERRTADQPPVTTTVDPALAVRADRSLLERAVEGLVAVAGAENAPVGVSARAGADGEVVLVVSGRPADAAALVDPTKGAPSDPTGRALSMPLARRIAAALGGSLAAGADGWRLVLPAAREDAVRPDPAADP